jgi:hypothetical protein
MPSEQAEQVAWTFLVYLAGNNNLTQEMAWGLQELKKTADRLNTAEQKSKDGKPAAKKAEEQINVVAHFDPRGSRGRRYDFHPPAKNNKGLPGGAQGDGDLEEFEAMVFTPAVVRACTRKFVHRLAGPAGASPGPSSQLTAFLGEQIGRLPRAKQFFLVLSGHGSGAVGDFLTDLDPNTSLSIPELARILGEGRQAYAETHPEDEGLGRIGILGMDSCLMSNAEVCFEVRKHAEFLVASEGFVENTGWPYHRVLEALIDPDVTRPSRKARPVALRVADHYSSFYRDQEIAGVSTDIAVCDLAAFREEGRESLLSRLRAFSKECIPRLEGVYVHQALATAFGRPGRAVGPNSEPARGQRALERLSRDIARNLRLGPQDRDELVDNLVEGSTRAREDLAKSPWRGPLAVSQLEALRQLLDSMVGRYDLQEEPTLADRLDAVAPSLPTELVEPSSYANVLAVARVLREFDPGVQQALRLIQEEDAQRNPMAKTARSRLLKLHHVRWWLDLYELCAGVKQEGKPKARDFRLRDALVAARFQAQSFKAGIYVDLVDLCQSLEVRVPGDRVRSLCRGVQRAVEGTSGRKGAVVRAHYTGPAFQHAHGLSAYFPFGAEDYTSEYENLEFAERTAWGRFLRAYLRVTRRDRRDESRHWASADDPILRFGDLEVDPLEEDGIEARIVGVAAPLTDDDRCRADEIQAGTKKRLRAGGEGKIRAGGEGKIRAGGEGKIRAGGEGKIRAGGEGKIRAGGEGKIKGEGILTVWGNPPDGFFRQ